MQKINQSLENKHEEGALTNKTQELSLVDNLDFRLKSKYSKRNSIIKQDLKKSNSKAKSKICKQM